MVQESFILIDYLVESFRKTTGITKQAIKPYCDDTGYEAKIIQAGSPKEAVKIAIEKSKKILGIIQGSK